MRVAKNQLRFATKTMSLYIGQAEMPKNFNEVNQIVMNHIDLVDEYKDGNFYVDDVKIY